MGCKIGDVCEFNMCCREVRLGSTPCEVGKKLDGWNTIADEHEEWVVVEVRDNPWHSLVKRIK